jgi:hypothetical protein
MTQRKLRSKQSRTKRRYIRKNTIYNKKTQRRIKKKQINRRVIKKQRGGAPDGTFEQIAWPISSYDLWKKLGKKMTDRSTQAYAYNDSPGGVNLLAILLGWNPKYVEAQLATDNAKHFQETENPLLLSDVNTRAVRASRYRTIAQDLPQGIGSASGTLPLSTFPFIDKKEPITVKLKALVQYVQIQGQCMIHMADLPITVKLKEQVQSLRIQGQCMIHMADFIWNEGLALRDAIIHWERLFEYLERDSIDTYGRRGAGKLQQHNWFPGEEFIKFAKEAFEVKNLHAEADVLHEEGSELLKQFRDWMNKPDISEAISKYANPLMKPLTAKERAERKEREEQATRHTPLRAWQEEQQAAKERAEREEQAAQEAINLKWEAAKERAEREEQEEQAAQEEQEEQEAVNLKWEAAQAVQEAGKLNWEAEREEQAAQEANKLKWEAAQAQAEREEELR